MGTHDRKRFRPAAFSDSDDDKTTGVFDKFFVVQSLEHGKTFSNVSPFVIEKTIFSVIGKTNNIKKLRDGKLLVEIIREKQGKNLQKLESFCDIKCTVSPHKTLNSSKGIIRDRRLFCCSEEEIVNNLASQGVTHARRIKMRKGDKLVDTNTIILTFNNPIRPDKLVIFFEIIPVRPYIPNPLRCFECQKFGHHENNCKNTLICAHCAGVGNHHEGSCDRPAKCANCGGPHPASSNKCPTWLKEKEVTRVKFTNNISYPEARKLVENTPSPEFSKIVQSSMRTTRSIGIQTCDAGTQTELPESTVSTPFVVKSSVSTDRPSASADKPPASAGKLSASADKPDAADKKSASADRLSASAAAKASSEIPKPGSKGNRKADRSKTQPHKAESKTGSARSPSRKGQTPDPLKTGNRFGVLKDEDSERMDCESSPSPSEPRQQNHSPIRPPT